MTAGLLLVGASGLAREVLAAGITGVVGIIDDDVERHGSEIAGVPVLGGTALAVRREVARRLMRAGVDDDRFETFVARTARIGRTCDVGPGSIVLDGVVVTADARLGQHVVVMPNCTITHDDELGDFATLAAGVALGGSVHVGKRAYVGMNASVRQGVMIGNDATIGMGAVVLHDVPEGETWAGVPARRLGRADD